MSVNNGRVISSGGPNNQNFEPYSLFKDECSKQFNLKGNEALKSIHSKNALSDVFFSRQNMDALQDAIRFLVYEKSCKKHVIDRQSETDLVVIMRSVYLEYGEYKPYHIADQVRELNAKVLEYCVPRILQEIKLYLHYRQDITTLPVPLERGEFTSTKGSKVLEQRF